MALPKYGEPLYFLCRKPLLIAEYFTEVSATSSSYKEPLHHNGGSLLVPASTQLVSSSAHSANLIAGSSLPEISAASTKSSSLFLHQIPVAVSAPSNKVANHNMSVEFASVSRSFNTNAMRQYDHHADDCSLDVDRRSDRRAPRHDDFFSDVFNPFSPTRSLNQVLNMMNQFMENPFFNVGNRLCIGISSDATIRTTTIPFSHATTTQLVGTFNTRIRRLVDGRSIRLPLLYDIADILIHTQSKSRCYVELYVKDEDAFFRDYEKLSDLGFVPSSKANSPKDRTVLAEGAIGVVVTATAEDMEHACIMFDEMHKRNTSTLLIMAVHTDCTGCLVSKNCWMVLCSSGNARSMKLEDLEKILKLCAAKRIPMVVANPDYVTVEERDLRVMSGALAARFLDVFAACLSHNSVFSSLLSKITSTSRSSTQDVRLWDASSILIGTTHSFEGYKAARFRNDGNVPNVLEFLSVFQVGVG
ncbi:heat shock 22 kDa protein, mitochondrial isoform X2 [Sesbania bispinosa]|nr:heat shock 22 kDa protein, mitochondrial isoform X2 [Sesbania bispinosa]